MRLIRSLALLVICATQIEAFVAPQPQRCVSPLVLHSTSEDEPTESKKGGLEAGVKNKLLAETIAPWRSVRLFLYGALGSGAFVGGMITLTGVAAALSGARSDLDLGVEVSRCCGLGVDVLILCSSTKLAPYSTKIWRLTLVRWRPLLSLPSLILTNNRSSAKGLRRRPTGKRNKRLWRSRCRSEKNECRNYW